MELIPARCPCCGGAIRIPAGTDRSICPSCGMQVLTEAAVAFVHVQVDSVVETRQADFQVEGGMLLAYHGESPEVRIPHGVRVIGPRCFAGLPIGTVAIPEGVVAIGTEAFAGCSFLTQAWIAESVVRIDRDAFAGCTSLISVVWPRYEIAVAKQAFNGTPVLRTAMEPVWQSQSRCRHCGGPFNGSVIRKRCARCGRPKDY